MPPKNYFHSNHAGTLLRHFREHYPPFQEKLSRKDFVGRLAKKGWYQSEEQWRAKETGQPPLKEDDFRALVEHKIIDSGSQFFQELIQAAIDDWNESNAYRAGRHEALDDAPELGRLLLDVPRGLPNEPEVTSEVVGRSNTVEDEDDMEKEQPEPPIETSTPHPSQRETVHAQADCAEARHADRETIREKHTLGPELPKTETVEAKVEKAESAQKASKETPSDSSLVKAIAEVEHPLARGHNSEVPEPTTERATSQFPALWVFAAALILIAVFVYIVVINDPSSLASRQREISAANARPTSTSTPAMCRLDANGVVTNYRIGETVSFADGQVLECNNPTAPAISDQWLVVQLAILPTPTTAPSPTVVPTSTAGLTSVPTRIALSPTVKLAPTPNIPASQITVLPPLMFKITPTPWPSDYRGQPTKAPPGAARNNPDMACTIVGAERIWLIYEIYTDPGGNRWLCASQGKTDRSVTKGWILLPDGRNS